MPDDNSSKRSLSEIGHLFLSSVRERHTNGAPQPLRRGPGAPPPMSVDLTAEEFASTGDCSADQSADNSGARPKSAKATIPAVSLLISSHLNGMAGDRVADYAAHVARTGRRVGLIEIDGPALRVTVFEPRGSGQSTQIP